MKKCLNCGKENIFNSEKFCECCGNNHFENSTLYCPACRDTICEHFEFCGNCGYSLHGKEKLKLKNKPKGFINRLLYLFEKE